MLGGFSRNYGGQPRPPCTSRFSLRASLPMSVRGIAQLHLWIRIAWFVSHYLRHRDHFVGVETSIGNNTWTLLCGFITHCRKKVVRSTSSNGLKISFILNVYNYVKFSDHLFIYLIDRIKKNYFPILLTMVYLALAIIFKRYPYTIHKSLKNLNLSFK